MVISDHKMKHINKDFKENQENKREALLTYPVILRELNTQRIDNHQMDLYKIRIE